MKGKVKIFPVTGKIKEKTLILTPTGEVKKVKDVLAGDVFCEDDSQYSINVVTLVKKYITNRWRIAELHYGDYDLPLDTFVTAETKESLTNGFIGDQVRVFKLNVDMMSEDYIKIEPILGMIVDIAENNYIVESVHGKRFTVKRHFFEILNRSNTKLVGKVIR
jgi:hypothetical protein